MAFINSQGRTQSSLADINVTPLVDVVLVLLIIFMVTAPVLQSGIEWMLKKQIRHKGDWAGFSPSSACRPFNQISTIPLSTIASFFRTTPLTFNL
jgi:hypothetical protein